MTRRVITVAVADVVATTTLIAATAAAVVTVFIIVATTLNNAALLLSSLPLPSLPLSLLLPPQPPQPPLQLPLLVATGTFLSSVAPSESSPLDELNTDAPPDATDHDASAAESNATIISAKSYKVQLRWWFCVMVFYGMIAPPPSMLTRRPGLQ